MARKLALSVTFAAAGAASLAGCAQPTPVPLAPVATVANAPFVYGGQNYCWYQDGWQSAGFYQCGYAWRTGLGWGGGYGWNGWGGGYATGWHGYGVWRGAAWRHGYGWHGGYGYHGGYHGVRFHGGVRR
jgi:hypothetical protein